MFVQILKDCVPHEVFPFLSDHTKAPNHNHKSIILNLACGASVNATGARHRLLEG
jgi:hypothetical protein